MRAFDTSLKVDLLIANQPSAKVNNQIIKFNTSISEANKSIDEV